MIRWTLFQVKGERFVTYFLLVNIDIYQNFIEHFSEWKKEVESYLIKYEDYFIT